ncbi:immunogenic secreted protein [Streptococcus agalactiae]|nr:immunogenic secreted protein [Streptococcus agalactiae]
MSKQKVTATLLLSTLVLSLSSPLVTLAETINPETSLTMATASTESSSEAEKQEKT